MMFNDIGSIEGIEEKRNLIVNNTVFINDGKIANNPFSKRLNNSEASQWILKNEGLVKSNIQKRFNTLGISWGDVDDCFDTLLHEFNSRKSLQFNKNHFGKGSGYTIDEFVLNRLKYVVISYRNQIKEKKVIPLIKQDETTFYGEIEENFSKDDSLESIDDVVNGDERYWDGLFNDLSSEFIEFLIKRHYKEFDYEKLIYYMYLDVGHVGKNVDVEEKFNRVSEKIGESVELVKTVVEDLVEAVKENDDNGKEILNKIKELLEGIEAGWIPKNIRK